jgi:hypothetical protein
MAAPTITSITPSTVWTGGQLVIVRGTNFRLPSPPSPTNGPLPDPIPTVAVTVEARAATQVEVLSSTVLSCHLPEHDPSRLDDGTVVPAALTVTNLDDAGAPIAGESRTSPAAVTYARPDLAIENDGGRVERAFLRMLKRRIVDNVVKLAISPDFGDAPFAVTRLANPPGLVVTGPRCREDRPHFNTHTPIAVPSQLGGGLVDIKAPPMAVALEYSIAGYTNSGAQNTSLMLLTRKVLDLFTYLEVQRDANDASKGTIRYQVIVPADSEARDTSTPNQDGNHSFDGLTVVIHGVGLEDLAGFPGQSLDRVGVGTQEEFDLDVVAKT